MVGEIGSTHRKEKLEMVSVKKCIDCYWLVTKGPHLGCYPEGRFDCWISKKDEDLPRDCENFRSKLSSTILPEARPVKDKTPINDQIRVDEFSKKMVEKWQKGRSQYGTAFTLDPLEEAQGECVDLANYALETYFRIKVLREKLSRR